MKTVKRPLIGASFWFLTLLFLNACLPAKDGLFERQSSLNTAHSHSCQELYPLPITGDISVVTDKGELTLSYLDRGSSGVVYVPEEKSVVYKFPFNDGGLRDLTEAQEEALYHARSLYEDEKKLFLDLPKDSEELQGLASYLAQTEPVTVRYENKSVTGLRKEFISGRTIDEVPEYFDDPQFLTETKKLYQYLKKAYFDGHEIYDLHDRNLVYDPTNSKRPLTIVDGGYTGKGTDETADSDTDSIRRFLFTSFCKRQNWCQPHVEADPDF